MTAFVLQRISLVVLLSTGLFSPFGCQNTYYAALEQLGYHKRELLVSRVKDARDSQEEAKEQFKSALEKFSTVLHFNGGVLEDKYTQLNAELERSESSASAVHSRIQAVEDVSEALFKEWEAELAQYTSETLRRDSARQLNAARRRYAPLIRAMQRAEAKIDPVLSAFRDQVLYLKHNLNARAIASLQGELTSIETNIDALVREMEAAISEADTFIKAIGNT